MSQVTEQSVRFQTALASIKLIQASAVLDLTEDDFDFLTSNKVWIATDRSEERFSRNAETDLVCRLLLEKKKRADFISSSVLPSLIIAAILSRRVSRASSFRWRSALVTISPCPV